MSAQNVNMHMNQPISRSICLCQAPRSMESKQNNIYTNLWACRQTRENTSTGEKRRRWEKSDII